MGPMGGGMYGGMHGGMPMGGMMPPMGGPLYYNGSGGGMHPSMAYNQNNMSALAGAGLNAMNMPHSYQYPADNGSQSVDQYYNQMPKNPAEFEDSTKIIDGRDINHENKDKLMTMLAAQLGEANQKPRRDRPPSQY